MSSRTSSVLMKLQIIKTFGFSELNTYLVQAPPYAIAYGKSILPLI